MIFYDQIVLTSLLSCRQNSIKLFSILLLFYGNSILGELIDILVTVAVIANSGIYHMELAIAIAVVLGTFHSLSLVFLLQKQLLHQLCMLLSPMIQIFFAIAIKTVDIVVTDISCSYGATHCCCFVKGTIVFAFFCHQYHLISKHLGIRK